MPIYLTVTSLFSDSIKEVEGNAALVVVSQSSWIYFERSCVKNKSIDTWCVGVCINIAICCNFHFFVPSLEYNTSTVSSIKTHHVSAEKLTTETQNTVGRHSNQLLNLTHAVLRHQESSLFMNSLGMLQVTSVEILGQLGFHLLLIKKRKVE